MGSFEQAFSEVERAAASTARSAGDLAKLAKALEKAAKEGNIAAIKRGQSRLGEALNALRQEAANAGDSWPFQEKEEEDYLKDGYAAELRSVAAEKGLDIYERDGNMIAHPAIVRTLPGSRAVRIDRKQVSTLRPSYIAEILIRNQQKPARVQTGQFLSALYQVYCELTREESPARTEDSQGGQVIELVRIYRLFTALPGSNREYDRTDFARSLYHLDSSKPQLTVSGMRVSFPSSGARRVRSENVFDFVAPSGQRISYYGIRFSKEE